MKSDKQRSDNLASSLTECIDQMQATPRTDALLREFQPADTARELDLARLGRQLERELAKVRKALAEACTNAIACLLAYDRDGTPTEHRQRKLARLFELEKVGQTGTTDSSGGEDSKIGAEEK